MACDKQPKYTLTVTEFPAEMEGKTVYLQRDTSMNQFVTIDSALVTEGKIIIKGYEWEEPFVGNLKFDEWRKPQYPYRQADFIVEQGKITIALDSTSHTVGGTPLNEAYEQIRKNDVEYTKVASKYYKNREEIVKDSVLKNEYIKKMEIMHAENISKVSELISQNIKNPVGVRVFLSKMPSYKAQERLDFIEQMREKEQNIIFVTHIKMYAEAELATSEGNKYRDFKGKTLDGKEMALSDVVSKNKYVLLDFWASWCGPCIQELPNVKKAYEKYKGKGFEVFGASIDRSEKQWKEAVATHQLSWPQVIINDRDGENGASLYGVMGIPYTVLIDQEGTIVRVNPRGDGLMNELDRLLK